MTHLLRYLLIFGDRKKKVELSVREELENVKVETLKQKARELFNLQNVILQIWDKGFEDWVDLDEGDPTPTNSRIKVEVNKEAKSASSNQATLLVPTSKIGPPTVQVRPSYPAFALTTLEVPQTVSSPPSSIKLQQLSHPVSSPQSVVLPQRTMSDGQRQYGTEQPTESQTTGRTSSLTQGGTLDVGRSSIDGSNNAMGGCQHCSPVTLLSQDRSVLDHIQQSFSFPTRLPEETSTPSLEDTATQTPLLQQEDQPVEALNESVPGQYLQGSVRTAIIPSPDDVSCQNTSAEHGNRLVAETIQQSSPAPCMNNLPTQEITFPATHDIVTNPQTATCTAEGQEDHVVQKLSGIGMSRETPEDKVVQESSSVHLSRTTRVPEESLHCSHNPLHQTTPNYVKYKPNVNVSQEAHFAKDSAGSISYSQDHVPSPIFPENELTNSGQRGQDGEQMPDGDQPPLQDHIDLVLTDYKLPSFPAEIIQRLDHGACLEPKEKSIILDTIFESVIPFTYYPSSSDYTYLTKKLLEKYPKLLPQVGAIQDFHYQWEAWRQKLMYKFKNRRKRQDRDAPSVRHYKRMKEGELDKDTTAYSNTAHSDITCLNGADDEVSEAMVDEELAGVCQKDSLKTCMDKDIKANQCDTQDVASECLNQPLSPQPARILERNNPSLDPPQQCKPVQSHNDLVMACVMDSVSSRVDLEDSGIADKSIPLSQKDGFHQEPTSHLQIRSVIGAFQESSSSMCNEVSRLPRSNLQMSEHHTKDSVPSCQPTMPSSQNKPTMEVEMLPGCSSLYGQILKSCGSALLPSRDYSTSLHSHKNVPSSTGQEQRLTEGPRAQSPTFVFPERPSLSGYKLPKFTSTINRKIKNCIPIESHDRSIILDTLYESVIPYTFYPTAADYIYLTSIFLNQYPQLFSQAGPTRAGADNFEAWRQKLMYKFKNKRKRQDRDAAAVQERTRKKTRNPESLDEGSSGLNSGDIDLVTSYFSDDAAAAAADDDDVLEVIDDDEDIVNKEDTTYHVMAADTTKIDDTPMSEAVKESNSVPLNSTRNPDRNLPCSQNQHSNPPNTLLLQNQPVKEVIQESSSMQRSVYPRPPERTLPSQHPGVKGGLPTNLGRGDNQIETHQRQSSPTFRPESLTLYDYKLPEFPSHIIQKLSCGMQLATKDISTLLNILYDSIVPYTYYPSASTYNYITKMLLEQYPQLLSQTGPMKDCPDSWEAWRQKLMHKFKNRRKRQDRDAPAVQQRFHKKYSNIDGLDEFPGESEQDLNEGRDSDWIEKDDDEGIVFEVVDDEEEDIVVKEENTTMAADTTNLGSPSVKRTVQESVSLPSYIQSSRSTEDDPIYQPSISMSQGKLVNEIILESCFPQPSIQVSRHPETILPSYQEGLQSTEETFSSSSMQREMQIENEQRKRSPIVRLESSKLRDYKLPEFPFSVLHKLDRGIPLATKDVSILLNTMYESIIPYTYYPTKSDYNYFTKILLEQHPQLLRNGPKQGNCPDNWEAWRHKLMHKFKNKRKRQDRDAPAVQERARRKFDDLDEFQGFREDTLNESREWISGDQYEQDDEDEVFDVMDDDEDVVIEEQDTTYHVMAADTTDISFPPVSRTIPEASSLSPYIQGSGNPERNLPVSQDDQIHQPSASFSQTRPIKDVTQESSLSQTPLQEARLPKTALPSFQVVPHSATIDEDLPQRKSPATLRQERLFLYDYKLPEFPSHIIQKLECGVQLATKDISTLLNILYESIVPYTFYPTTSDYNFFTKILLDRHPKLLTQAGPKGGNHPDNWEVWRQKVMHKFKNKRKRQDRDAPAVQQRAHRKFGCYEGLEELPGSSGLHLSGGDWITSSCPEEDEDEDVGDVSEGIIEVKDIIIKEEDTEYHVMAADTTNVGDT
ncbi:uncharacterized protein LOC121416040 [Lytechinus variegatus]|uniref:uncharacterized protein LOC121416040 n=1 Tax=Lytechinus variegatus TaxID=7654 RepID=UPI001BB2B828|nr:uncharacterized protein LOC121416040 [Lytechinus variegatus]